MKDTGSLKRPALIIAPTSLTGNWLHEAAQFTPHLKVVLIHGPERMAGFAEKYFYLNVNLSKKPPQQMP